MNEEYNYSPLTEEEWNGLTKDQQGDWTEYWSNLEEEEVSDE